MGHLCLLNIQISRGFRGHFPRAMTKTQPRNARDPGLPDAAAMLWRYIPQEVSGPAGTSCGSVRVLYWGCTGDII